MVAGAPLNCAAVCVAVYVRRLSGFNYLVRCVLRSGVNFPLTFPSSETPWFAGSASPELGQAAMVAAVPASERLSCLGLVQEARIVTETA